MDAAARTRIARREDLELTGPEFAILKRLDTPQKIQLFINAIPANQRRAHCIEGAFVAACALWVHGDPPLVVHIDCDPSDYPHVIAIFRRGATWGAISKHNGPQLRYRDPVYRSLRELAMSYFHEYFDRRGRKTLRSYSRAFDLRGIDPELWITSETACTQAHDRLARLRHYAVISKRQERMLSRRDSFERKASRVVEHAKPAATKP